ncbi:MULTISPECIES: trigger factor [unclassified Motilimonas]|uniref:trigger factor n=1 Tax=unclassified Motilimonas TaxID=2643697 RepID=UPI001E3DAAF7|nr:MULTISPECIES: trigger factor [unclassified Motilimonas]MCE0557586.1 trigger factor [Motilimonas sp. E26]MDO6526263.1 trigger factor [Motilimonas sp. 1_MG-2023]
MQASVETTQGLERRLTITVPGENFDKELNSRLSQLAKTQRIDGFRPGKVPAKVIQKRFGAAVSNEVAGELMQRNFFEAIMAEKLNPAGAPALEPSERKAGEDFTFVATFEVYPEVALGDFAALEVEKKTATVTDADLDNMLVTLQKQHATWVEVDAPAADENQATIDFVGTIDGEEFDGGKAEGFKLAIGAGRMIPGFEDGVKGKKAGESFDIDVTFPEEYHAENLKGKAAKFAITLSKVEALELPEINEEFVKKFGVESGDIEALKAEVKKNMTRELEQTLKNSVKEQVLDAVVKANEIDVPKSLVASEVDVLRQQAMQRFGGQMDPKNMPELPAELFEEQAVRRVKVGLLLGEVIRSNELKVDEARVDAIIENAASAYEDPAEVVAYYKGNKEALQNIQNVALEEQAVEFILEKAKVVEKETTFDEVMNKAAANA